MATLEAELAGLDALELAVPPRRSRASRIWSATWPKLGAAAIALLFWQIVVWSGWKPEFLLPAPATVFKALFTNLGDYVSASATTLQRAVIGFAIAVVIGTFIGAVVTRSRVLRSAVGSMVTGLMTMPSIAWFPMAIVLFGLKESAILFVIVIGAAPSVANGFIAGVDNTPPVLIRAAHMLGAKGWTNFRHVVLPAALPTYIGGLKQGWAFAWRSLLAGELLVQIAGKSSLGRDLDTARQLPDFPAMYATMVVIFVIGVLVDSLVFGKAERAIRKRYGLIDAAAAD
ncbi:MAG TPA: ABC transporter permease [Acidimicrobiia bacterium]|jgi:NitT/TauT family transport system permease protein